MYKINMSKREKELIVASAPGAKKRIDDEYNTYLKHYEKNKNKVPPRAEWVKVEGTQVLRIKDSRYIAYPETRRKNSKNFIILDVKNDYEDICFLRKKEVESWLTKMWREENDSNY